MLPKKVKLNDADDQRRRSHGGSFTSDVRNIISESELIVVGRHWSF